MFFFGTYIVLYVYVAGRSHNTRAIFDLLVLNSGGPTLDSSAINSSGNVSASSNILSTSRGIFDFAPTSTYWQTTRSQGEHEKGMTSEISEEAKCDIM